MPRIMAMKVSIIGSGYVGLVSGVCLAHLGHDVTLVDIDEKKVAAVNAGTPPIHEAGLDELMKATVGQNLHATTDFAAAIAATEITLIAGPTPFAGDKIDLQFVIAIAEQIGDALKTKSAYHTVVVKSTVVPGTTDTEIRAALERVSGKCAGVDFGLGMNPEFLSEGVAVKDFLEPDRIVIGGVDDRSIDALAQLYASFTTTPTLRTNCRTAEMIKYASNCFQATLISFANEIANLSSACGGVDAMDVMKGLHLMQGLTFVPRTPATTLQRDRVTSPIVNFLSPGCGFGGSCFPKDIRAIVAHGEAHNSPMRLMRAVVDINDRQPARVVRMVQRKLGDLHGKRIAVMGLAFKPGTDDMRESPSLPIVRELCHLGAEVVAFDPIAHLAAQRVLSDVRVTFADSMAAAVSGAAAVVLVTRWPEFKALPDLINRQAPPPVLIDGRRFIHKDAVETYDGIGL